MAIQGFDYKGFAQNLTAQAAELVPEDFNDVQKEYVVNTLLNFSTVAGEALYNDTESNFNIDQAVMITQIIAEWSFHKSVDLVRSGIPQQYWDPVMQKIAFTVFEIAKQVFKQSLPQDQILQLIEHHVKKTYVEAIEELKSKNLIDDELGNKATNQSNIDEMMQQQIQQEQQSISEEQIPMQSDLKNQNIPQAANTATPKTLKLATLALLFRQMKQEKVQSILNKFNTDDAHTIIRFMETPDLSGKVDPKAAMRCLQDIRTNFSANKTISAVKSARKIQNISEYFDRNQLEDLLKLERPKVKRFVFNALEGEQYEIAPRIANIIATHVEDSV